MRVLAISTAGYRGADDVIDSMHLLRAQIFRGRWNETSKFGRGRGRRIRSQTPHIHPSSDTISSRGGIRVSAARDWADHDLGPVPDLEWTGPAAPSCSDGRKFSLLRLYLAGSGEGRGGCCTQRDARYVCDDHRTIEWSTNGYREIVTGTDVRFERILKRAG